MIYINNIFPLKGERWFPRLYGMCLPPTTVHFSIAPGYSIWVSYLILLERNSRGDTTIRNRLSSLGSKSHGWRPSGRNSGGTQTQYHIGKR